MNKEENVKKSYELAKERYAALGVDTEKALEDLAKVKLSIHCWQGDDIHGFLFPNQELTGGIGVSGNYPGLATTPDQLSSDLSEGLSLIPGKHKVQLHATYAVTDKPKDLDELEPEDFKYWVDWAKKEGVGLDMNGTFFSHPMLKDGFTLASPDKNVRDFWIEHGKRSRRIAEYFGKELGQQSVNNFWVPDGYKDNPIDKISPRRRLMASLDEIIKEPMDEKNTIEAFEGKLFGTGVESYTVGSHEFYENYALTRQKLWTIDAGHFHPTEDVSDKFSAFLPFGKGLMLHVSRPVRWDSDHVVIFDDALIRIMRSLVRDDLLGRTNIGLDFFDATINRVSAWVVGARASQKAILQAMLAPIDDLKKAEEQGDYTKRLAVTEELKSYPFGAVWDEFCVRNNVPVGEDWLDNIKDYENNVQFKR
ncbi:L-rhamnose isomerase [Latilactobacillus sakei]|uniref:L-rhamnose isomerase n=1 Tax=Lactobacillaceae TaxID=33958 RepID=UPI0005579738|nr:MULTISPECIES: L-rhamnose isomerase [Lactobacillaceae]ARJ72135.1 L-rhamnose isomerase [Latilactobacillus sakei]KRK69081.1 L-rhamnose isomerase [Latilactobacillus sakei subsp. sakei DSM 20017 = JCM 1157]MDG9751980.1 L-rhamnose isomerase [Latilactobacillus sakei]MDH0601210.1 L-rhamnose isomerase [Latilactobacillus sakei]MDN4010487.1 L-rhamnose isomerase [Latilactobacillus sakei]